MREALPQASFYVETDYSAQICADLTAGELDLGLVFTPRPHPDLHIETLGEVRFRMVSTETDRLAQVSADTYLLANHSPAFARAHAARLPALSRATIASGQSATLAAMLTDLGGAAYVQEATAQDLVGRGLCRLVRDAPSINQTVHAGVHVRDRHRNLHRRILALLRSRFAVGAPSERRRRPREETPAPPDA
jgi:DNA-binding transcriptional LysR family regulator